MAVCVAESAVIVDDGLYCLLEAVEKRLGSGVWLKRVLRLDKVRASACEEC